MISRLQKSILYLSRKVVEDWGDVFISAGGGEPSTGRVLNVLEFVEDVVGRAAEDAAAVVGSGGHEGMDENFGGSRGEGGRMFLRWKKAGVVMWLAWGRKEGVGSTVIPRLQSRMDGVTMEPSMLRERRSGLSG